MSLQFIDKDVMQDSVKCFAKVRVEDISCSQCCNPVIEGDQICGASFALSEATWAATTPFFIFHVL